MKTASLLALAVGPVTGFRGMQDLKARAAELDARGTDELLGDLGTLPDNQLTFTASNIKNLLTGRGIPEELFNHYVVVPDRNSAACRADTCCIWKHIADVMRREMVGSAGRCNNLARQCVRIGFHDAGSWSKSNGLGGGADGSIVLAGECYTRPINRGLESGCDRLQAWYDEFRGYGISMADLIQFAANVATVTCPLGPRVRSFVGRRDTSEPAPDGLLPEPTDNADRLIALFLDKTISPDELVALVGAHTTAQQFFFDERRAGDPLDGTPGVWDVRFYGQVLNPFTPRRIVKLPSDISLSRDRRTRATWLRVYGSTKSRE
ncbi:ligninase H2 precursor [Ophiocordyceps camponoti-floridani]|uniref:Peroxidase n=1 Tax=Ophiocordyceps camponoti-floridani TaxID=2030778 RepID=A0A8H4Q809_9HYPO|nr:ligninase H2 precursor [Ophiocordyceps camponoti-floridani]